MNTERFQLSFFLIFVIAALCLNFFIFLPYFSVLFLALVLAVTFAPSYRRVLSAVKHEGISAFLTVGFVFLLIVGPVFLVGTLLFTEVSDIYVSLTADPEGTSIQESIDMVEGGISKYLPGVTLPEVQIDTNYLKSGLSWILDHLSFVFKGALKISFGLFLMLLALFYFLRDGRKFMVLLAELSPLQNSYDRKIFERITVAVNAVVRGHLVISLCQALLTGIGFTIFGVPNPVLWGVITIVASLVPTIGTALVFIPAVAFLFVTSSPLFAVGLTLWGVLAVGLIDNLLGPIIMNRGAHIHPFLILLGALGGLAFLGPIGFLAGPVAVALLMVLLDLYPTIVRGKRGRRKVSSRRHL